MPLSSRETRQLRLKTYIHQTIYRVPDVLPGGDEDAGHDQDHHCGLVVEPEHIVINADRVKLQELEEATEYVQHSDTVVLLSSALSSLYREFHCTLTIQLLSPIIYLTLLRLWMLKAALISFPAEAHWRQQQPWWGCCDHWWLVWPVLLYTGQGVCTLSQPRHAWQFLYLPEGYTMYI